MKNLLSIIYHLLSVIYYLLSIIFKLTLLLFRRFLTFVRVSLEFKTIPTILFSPTRMQPCVSFAVLPAWMRMPCQRLLKRLSPVISGSWVLYLGLYVILTLYSPSGIAHGFIAFSRFLSASTSSTVLSTFISIHGGSRVSQR